MKSSSSAGRQDIHLFEIAGSCFLLDVEETRLFSLSASAYEYAKKRVHGNSPYPATFSEWCAKRDVDKIWKTISPVNNDAIGKSCRQLESQPLEITGLWLGLSHRCNLSCSYCFANEPGYLKGETLMTWETAKKAVDFLLASSPDLSEYEIIFFGGEPLLQFDILRQVVEYCEGFRKTGKKFVYSITTNGTLLAAEVFDFLSRHKVAIMISIDGTKALHDKNRCYQDGSPSWDDILSNLHNIPDFGQYLMARVTVPDTQVSLLEIYKTMRNIGFRDIVITEVCPNSGELPMFPLESYPVWKEQYLEMAQYIMETEPDAYEGGLSSLSGYARALREREKSLYCCATGINYFYVTPQGSCYPCMRLITKDEKNKMGSIFTSIDEKMVDMFRCNHIYNRTCRSCWARYLCGGMCYGDSFALTGDIHHPVAVFCLITRYKIEVSAYLLWKLQQKGIIAPVSQKGWVQGRFNALRAWLNRGKSVGRPGAA